MLIFILQEFANSVPPRDRAINAPIYNNRIVSPNYSCCL
jgi:hypothetical protein